MHLSPCITIALGKTFVSETCEQGDPIDDGGVGRQARDTEVENQGKSETRSQYQFFNSVIQIQILRPEVNRHYELLESMRYTESIS